MDRKKLDTATGYELDVFGGFVNTHRAAGESDESYRAKLKEVFRDDGGFAFGNYYQAGDCTAKTGGMTLRDYFAARAMQGFCAAPDMNGASLDSVVGQAFEIADAMLAERAK